MKPTEPEAGKNEQESYETTAAALAWVHGEGMADEVVAGLEVRRRNRRRRILAGGAAVLVLVVVLGVARFDPSRNEAPLEAIPPTVAVIASSEMKLPDGSVVQLKNDAELIPAYTDEQRVVILLKGTAYFQVAKAHDRPFVVKAGEIGVRAVGTAFSVELISEKVDVYVTEGRVAVGANANRETTAQDESATAFVSGGECVSVPTAAGEQPDKTLVVRRISPEALADRLSWRTPRLEFSATPLADVVKVFNRHNEQQLELGDARLADLKLSGMLRANNLQALLRILKSQFNIEATNAEGNRIVLRYGHGQ